MGLILEDLNPMSVPYIADRERMLDGYADRWFADAYIHETLNDFCHQAGLDVGDKRFGFDLKARIRGRMRTRRAA